MLEDLRRQIDEIDEAIIDLLAQRFSLIKEIGLRKKAANLPIKDVKRESYLRKFHKEIAKRKGVKPTLISTIFDKVLQISKEDQSERLER